MTSQNIGSRSSTLSATHRLCFLSPSTVIFKHQEKHVLYFQGNFREKHLETLIFKQRKIGRKAAREREKEERTEKGGMEGREGERARDIWY